MVQVPRYNLLHEMEEAGMISKNIHFNAFKTPDELADILSKNIAAQLQEINEHRGGSSLVVSGGSTPKMLFKKLCRIDIDWAKVSVSLSDERWVDPTQNESNERLIKEYLLQDKAKAANFVGMYYEGYSAKKAQIICSDELESRIWPVDVMILGMGEDGHTASLFPNHPSLQEALNPNKKELCIAIDQKPHNRMSLTLQAILSAQHLYLHFEGAKKFKVYQEAIASDDMYAMPIRSILHQKLKEIEVYYA